MWLFSLLSSSGPVSGLPEAEKAAELEELQPEKKLPNSLHPFLCVGGMGEVGGKTDTKQLSQSPCSELAALGDKMLRDLGDHVERFLTTTPHHHPRVCGQVFPLLSEPSSPREPSSGRQKVRLGTDKHSLY